jgi:hypothetical protein
MDKGGARVGAEANYVPVADVYVSCGSEHDNLWAYTDMCTVPLHSAADVDPITITKSYSVIASAFESTAEDTTADGDYLCDVVLPDPVGPLVPRTERSVPVGHGFR